MTAVTFVNVGYTNTLTPVAFWSWVPCVPQLRIIAPSPLPLVGIDVTFCNAFVFPSYEPLRSFQDRREYSYPFRFFVFHLLLSALV